MDRTHDVDTALERLGRQDPDLAATAAECHSLLVEGGGAHALSQYVVQGFLWYVLPRRWPAHLQSQALEACALLLEACGLDRYARICRSPRTTAVLAAYRLRERLGLACAIHEEIRSGIRPPDLPELGWSARPGPVEREAYLAAAELLELAVASGEVRTGSRDALRQRIEVTARCLEAPRPDLGGRMLLEGVLRERLERWAESGSEDRQRLLGPLVEVLAEPPAPGDLSGLAPVRWLLEGAEKGLPVNRRLDPARKLADEARRRFELGGELGTEGTIGLLLALLSGLGLARRRGRRLQITPRGRDLLPDPLGLWRRIASTVWTGSRPANAVAELTLALLLRGGPERERALATRVQLMLAGDGISAEETLKGLRRLAWIAEPLGCLTVDGPIGTDRGFALTDLGCATALVSLRARATRPIA